MQSKATRPLSKNHSADDWRFTKITNGELFVIGHGRGMTPSNDTNRYELFIVLICCSIGVR